MGGEEKFRSETPDAELKKTVDQQARSGLRAVCSCSEQRAAGCGQRAARQVYLRPWQASPAALGKFTAAEQIEA